MFKLAQDAIHSKQLHSLEMSINILMYSLRSQQFYGKQVASKTGKS